MPTETDDGKDGVPVAVDDTFHVRDHQSANWVLKKIIGEREYRARCVAWFEAETRRSEHREQFLMRRFGVELEEWTRQQLAGRHGKRRSVHLPAGILGFRTAPAKLVIVDEPKLLAWCRQHLPGAVKVVQHILKREVQNHIKGNGEIPDGAELTGAGDKFFIK
jgi:Bacteriophage Mu Gam like protein